MKLNKHLKKLIEQSVKESFEKDKLSVENAERFINSFKSLKGAEAILSLKAYLKGVKRKISEHTLELTSASPLSQDEIKSVEKRLNTKYNIQYTSYQQDTSLLGGLQVKIGDKVWSDSLKSRIDQIKGAIAT